MKTKLLISVAASLIMTSVGLADNPPSLGHAGDATSTPARGRVESPYWNNNSSNSLTAPLGDLPATDIRAVAPARAAAMQAKWTYYTLQSDLGTQTRLLWQRLERDPNYKKAVNDEADAWNAMETARREALAELQNNESYVASNHLHDLVKQQIIDMHQQEKPDRAQLTAAANVKMSFVSDNRKLESQVLAGNVAYQDARKKYLEAARFTSQLKDELAIKVLEDDNLVALRKQINEARIAHLSSDAYLDGTLEAANVAINYAKYYRSQDVYHGTQVNTPWNDGSYYPGGIRVVGY